MKAVEVAIERRDTHERIELADALSGPATELFHRLPELIAQGRARGDWSATEACVEVHGDVLQGVLAGLGDVHVPGSARSVPEADLLARIDPRATYLVEVSQL